MPSDIIDRPFDSIESAQCFMDVLAETIIEVMKDLDRYKQIATRENQTRRVQAMELAMFKLKTLNCHVYKSRRVLNDLRMIRRLILNERLNAEEMLAPVHGGVVSPNPVNF